MKQAHLELAQCREIGLEAFCGYEVTRGNRELGRYARGLCGGCPVITECANEALDLEDVGTIRAGVAIGDQQTWRARAALEFCAAHGYPATSLDVAVQWGLKYGVRPRSNAGPRD
ncbi:WhiB family transcriptional regulator [Nocardia sp. NPDC057440]|uniref:WhiB family transcriptional regulator n=1 Tax=Nocardia sp. NPDC057440 TaxID=3346134 RepID=UPI003670F15D